MSRLWTATLGAVLLTALLPAAGSAAHKTRPTLALTSMHPVTVVGTHFVAREWVRVTVSSQSSHVRAKRNGSFVVSFPALTFSHCSGFVVRAVGAHGTLAVWRLPRPMCLPARGGP